jgi:hypothetical protein
MLHLTVTSTEPPSCTQLLKYTLHMERQTVMLFVVLLAVAASAEQHLDATLTVSNSMHLQLPHTAATPCTCNSLIQLQLHAPATPSYSCNQEGQHT